MLQKWFVGSAEYPFSKEVGVIFQGYIWQTAFEKIFGRLPECYSLEVYGDELYLAFRQNNGEQAHIGPWHILDPEGIRAKTLAEIYMVLAEHWRKSK